MARSSAIGALARLCDKLSLKMKIRNWYGAARVGLIVSSTLFGFRARALEPQTLFNFQVAPRPITSPLVQGAGGSFYGTTPHGGASFSGQILRVCRDKSAGDVMP